MIPLNFFSNCERRNSEFNIESLMIQLQPAKSKSGNIEKSDATFEIRQLIMHIISSHLEITETFLN